MGAQLTWWGEVRLKRVLPSLQIQRIEQAITAWALGTHQQASHLPGPPPPEGPASLVPRVYWFPGLQVNILGHPSLYPRLYPSAGESLFLPALFLFPNLLSLVFDIFPQVLGILVSELGFPLSLFQPHAHSRWGSVSPTSIGFYL